MDAHGTSTCLLDGLHLDTITAGGGERGERPHPDAAQRVAREQRSL